MTETLKACKLNKAILAIEGPDAQTFLQGQLTNDITQLSKNTWQWSAYCTNQGKVITLFQIYQTQNGYHLLLPYETVDATMAQLNKYGVFSKISLTLKDNWTTIGIQGNQTTHWLNQQGITITDATLNTHQQIQILTQPNTPERYIITGPNGAITKHSTNLSLEDNNFWHHTDIQQKIPELTKQTTTQFTPHMLNLPELGAISFQKGCYTGQEIIARTQYRGQVKRQLHTFKSKQETPPIPGSPITTKKDEPAGTLINSVKNNDNSQLNLAIISNDLIEKKAELKIKAQDINA